MGTRPRNTSQKNDRNRETNAGELRSTKTQEETKSTSNGERARERKRTKEDLAGARDSNTPPRVSRRRTRLSGGAIARVHGRRRRKP